nr:hypothetical protein [Tanacetum cinerariifolium]
MQKLQREGLLESINDESFDKCESCISGKMTKKPFNNNIERATDLLEVELQLKKKIKALHCDRGGEYLIESESLGSPPELIPVRRFERTTRATNRLCLNLEVEDDEVGDLGEPANYKAAILNPDKVIWQGVMDEEMNFMKVMKVWIVVDLPHNAKVVRSKWLYKKKTNMDGKVHTYKARLQMDVKTAFLYGRLDEDIYTEQPEGYVDPKYPNRVCKLQRSIYGLKQASRQWNKRFDEEIKKFGFIQNHDEPCVYHKASGSDVVFLILYVDDILNTGNNIPRLNEVKDYLGNCFSMKDLGEAAYTLGIKIRGIVIDHSKETGLQLASSFMHTCD